MFRRVVFSLLYAAGFTAFSMLLTLVLMYAIGADLGVVGRVYSFHNPNFTVFFALLFLAFFMVGFHSTRKGLPF